MNLFNRVKSALFRGHEEEPEIYHPPAKRPITITHEKIHSMVLDLNIERIKRAMMLFDIRWIDDQGQSYSPNEEQIAQAAYISMANAMIIGRVIGAAEVRDKGFVSSFLLLPTGNEVISCRYVLTEASNIK